MISLALSDALGAWLAGQRALAGAAENTLQAYQADVLGFLAFMSDHNGGAQGLALLLGHGAGELFAPFQHQGVSAHQEAGALVGGGSGPVGEGALGQRGGRPVGREGVG